MISFQTNVTAQIAQNNLRQTGDAHLGTIQRLTSGYRISTVGFDPAGLAVADYYRSNISEISQGVTNANNAISMLQIMDGSLTGIHQIVGHLETLATQAASQTFAGSRELLNSQYQTLLRQIDTIADNSGLGQGVWGARNNTQLMVYIGGGTTSQTSQVSIDLGGTANRINSAALGLAQTDISAADGSGAMQALTALRSAVDALGLVQGRIGSGQNELTHAVRIAEAQVLSYTSAESRIRDADVAMEAANLTKGSVLQSASLAAMVSANAMPGALLGLLR